MEYNLPTMKKKKNPQSSNLMPPIEVPSPPISQDYVSSISTPPASSSPMASTPALSNPSPVQTPDDVALAQKSIGDQSYNGWCQAFVEHATQGKTGLYPSAIAAWQQQQNKAVPGLTGVKPGDPIYFAPNDSNEGYGHTGIYVGDNKFISATDNGVKTYDLNDWSNMTGQQILGYLKENS